MINIFDLVGRIFISLVLLLSGFNKIGNYEGTIGWIETFGMPEIFLIPAIILEVGAPILIIIGYKVKISAALLSLFCCCPKRLNIPAIRSPLSKVIPSVNSPRQMRAKEILPP